MTGLSDITTAELRAMLRDHAMIVGPGEVLVVMVPHWWPPLQCRDLRDALLVALDYQFPLVVTPGSAFGVAVMPPDPFTHTEHSGSSGVLTERRAAMSTAVWYGGLAYEINGLLDKGETLDLQETHQHILDRSLFAWLAEHFGGKIDLGLVPASERPGMLERFAGYSELGKTRKYYQVEHNGLSLLVAYCIEAMLHQDDD